ncbi:MAG TPA: response regulator [Kofleriaceae bacterium]|jgi:DNA-binding response OmpR family regulator
MTAGLDHGRERGLDRVLVVDDDPMQVELVERGLSRDGFEVRGVTTVDEMAILARQFAPDILLIDVNMPDASGERTIAMAREAAPGARIVLYSAWEESKLRVLSAQLGADGFISKSDSVVAFGRRLREMQRGYRS